MIPGKLRQDVDTPVAQMSESEKDDAWALIV